MRLNDKGVNLIAEFEGFSDRPYYATKDEKEKGIATIGFGMTFYPNGKKVSIDDKKITRDTAITYLEQLADKFSLKVSKLIRKELSTNQFNALVSLAYNIGIHQFETSTILKLVNINPNDANIAKQFLRWNKQDGKVIDGLTNRRIKESALYFTK
ncbi:MULTISPECIES: lysozyme [Flavobacteriaceae]|uniref:lysozyme n=1 Tax=Flavobacteriaceae TaxID=49546 RepID=UPI0025CCAD0E|nr:MULTISPECIES: lysozyme [Flavobacteriaceae]